MAWRETRPGEATRLLVPEEYVKRETVDENQLDSKTPDRPAYWLSGEGTVEMPLYVIANARDIKHRIGADELRDMAREMHADALKSGLREQQADNRRAWNEALVRGLERAKSEGSKALLKRLRLG